MEIQLLSQVYLYADPEEETCLDHIRVCWTDHRWGYMVGQPWERCPVLREEGIKIMGSGVSQLYLLRHMLAPGRPWASDFTFPRFHFLITKVWVIIVFTSNVAERYTHKFSGGSGHVPDLELLKQCLLSTLVLYTLINISPQFLNSKPLIYNLLCTRHCSMHISPSFYAHITGEEPIAQRG